MDRSDVCNLVSVFYKQDEYGVRRKVEESREVFCQVDSVSRSEFFDGGRNGLNPQFRITMFLGDYKDEPIVEYNGKRYAVYRTYHSRTDDIELYVERKGGTNGTA